MTTEHARSTPVDGAMVPAVPAEAVGRLIHDLNGLLSPIVGFTELLAADMLPEKNWPSALREAGPGGPLSGPRPR